MDTAFCHPPSTPKQPCKSGRRAGLLTLRGQRHAGPRSTAAATLAAQQAQTHAGPTPSQRIEFGSGWLDRWPRRPCGCHWQRARAAVTAFTVLYLAVAMVFTCCVACMHGQCRLAHALQSAYRIKNHPPCLAILADEALPNFQKSKLIRDQLTPFQIHARIFYPQRIQMEIWLVRLPQRTQRCLCNFDWIHRHANRHQTTLRL